MGVHAELGTDGGLHVLRPVESGRVNHPLDAGGPGAPDLQLSRDPPAGVPRRARAPAPDRVSARLQWRGASVLPLARFCFLTRFACSPRFVVQLQGTSYPIVQRVDPISWIQAGMMTHSGFLRVDSLRGRAYTRSSCRRSLKSKRGSDARTCEGPGVAGVGGSDSNGCPGAGRHRGHGERLVRRRASRRHRGGGQPGADRKSPHRRHRRHGPVPDRGPAARDLHGHLHAARASARSSAKASS